MLEPMNNRSTAQKLAHLVLIVLCTILGTGVFAAAVTQKQAHPKITFIAEPATPETNIHLDENSNLCSLPRRRCRNFSCCVFRIERDADLRSFRDACQACSLMCTDDRISDQYVVDSGVQHHFSFADFRDCNSRRATRDLTFGKFGDLVCLGMWPQ